MYLPWYMILFFMQEKEPEKLIYEIDLERTVRAGTYAPTGMGKQSPIIPCSDE